MPTARDCLAHGWTFSLCCPRCTTLHSLSANYANEMIRRGQGEKELGDLFEAGKFICGQHREPASYLSVTAYDVGAYRQVAAWQKPALK